MKTFRTYALAGAAVLALAACNRTEPAETAPPADATPATTAPATTDPMVGGAAMSPSADIVTNASKASNLTTLVSAVQAAGLAQTLQGAGPFTVFAPDNAAFDKVPAATRDQLMTPAGKADLTKILTYHVVPGRMTAKDLMAKIKADGGKTTLTTVEGEPLTASMMGNTLMLTDAKGGMSHVTIKDVMQSNGVIHVVDTVLMP